MKQCYSLLFIFLIFLSAAQEIAVVIPAPEYAVENEVSDGQERIISFNSDINIAENADVTVTENIKVYANGDVIKKGLFRALPMIRNSNDGQEKITYQIISVKKDFLQEPYHTEIKNGVFNLYIGDKNIFLDPGFYTYQIIYKTQDQIGKFQGYDEFYWNVNGTDWEFPVENIQATLTLPNGADILQSSCYTGNYGSKERNCASKNLSSTKITFKAGNLKTRENLTIAVGFKAGVLKEPSAIIKWIKKNLLSIPLILASIYLTLFYIVTWKKHGKDPNKPVIIPQFNAPENLSPASLGYIDKGEFDISQITANFVDLSIKGFVDIEENAADQDHSSASFRLNKNIKDEINLQEDQKFLLANVFDTFNKATINGDFNSKFKTAFDNFEKLISKSSWKYLQTEENNKFIFKALKIIIIAFLLSILTSCVYNGIYYSLLIAVPTLIFDSILIGALVSVYNDKSYKEFFVILIFTGLFMTPIFVVAFVDLPEITNFESNCFKFLLFSIGPFLLYRYFIIRPSAEKLKMRAAIEGLKLYLGTAEENELKFHNPPEMTTDLYQKFLPYAIVFGVEEIWGKRFRDQLKETIDSKTAPVFEDYFAGRFASSFSTSLTATTEEPYRSSSSSPSSSTSRSSSSSSYSGGSGSSGSSGGGSSGGGGGGGGGGGW